jgi:hypothetical protein
VEEVNCNKINAEFISTYEVEEVALVVAGFGMYYRGDPI